MVATLLEARQGIAQVLQLVDGLDNVYDYPHASPTPPCATVGWPERWTPGVRMGQESWEATIPVQVLTSMALNESADRMLSQFLAQSGATSISAAFDANPDLLGRIDGQAVVVNVTDIGPVRFGDEGIWYLGATFNVEVVST